MMKNFGKEYYVQSIRQKNKTLTEIAAETGVSINTVKARIKKCYQRKAWAERLIAIALENEKEQKEKQQKQQHYRKRCYRGVARKRLPYPFKKFFHISLLLICLSLVKNYRRIILREY